MAVTANEELCKQPAEKRKFGMEFANLLTVSATEEISVLDSITSEKIDGSTSDLTITMTGLEDGTKTNSKATFWIEGGTTGNKYRMEVQVTTTDGQILEGDGLLFVSDR